MATVPPQIVQVVGQHGLDGFQVTWANMQDGDVGGAIGSTINVNGVNVPSAGGGAMTGFADKTIQVSALSTMGSGGSVAVEGSNDAGQSWGALTNPTGTTIALTTLGQIAAVTEAPAWARPHVTGGDGTTSVTVVMFIRKTQHP